MMIKTQAREPFGLDLVLEFHAPSIVLSRGNRKGLVTFFRVLVPAIGMQVLLSPGADRLTAWLELFGLVARRPFSILIRWLKDPRVKWVEGRGRESDGVTIVQEIDTSEISLHTWPHIPGVCTGDGCLPVCLGYARLNVSTCSPDKLHLDKIIRLIKNYLNAEVYYHESRPWNGPRGHFEP